MPWSLPLPFNTRLYRTQRLALRARCEREGIACVLCGDPFDFSLRYPHPMSFVLHHDPPLADGADPCDVTGQWPAHKVCNEVQGTRRMSPAPVPMPRSEDWPE